MKKKLLSFLFLFIAVTSYSQFAWKPIRLNSWLTESVNGAVRAMNVSQTHINPTEYGFYFGGEFDTISYDSASVYCCVGAASPFETLPDGFQSFIRPDLSPNGVQHPSVWAIASSFDANVGHWFACGGKFSYEVYEIGSNEQEDFPQNIAFWSSGGMFANNEYLFPVLYIGMDTVFAIAIAPSHSSATAPTPNR